MLKLITKRFPKLKKKKKTNKTISLTNLKIYFKKHESRKFTKCLEINNGGIIYPQSSAKAVFRDKLTKINSVAKQEGNL